MTQDNSKAGPTIDQKSIKIGSSRVAAPGIDPPDCNVDVQGVVTGEHDEAESTLDIDFSRPFEGYDWSEHTDVSRLIDEIFAEYEVWYREDTPGERIRNRNITRQYLTHFVLEAYRVHRAQPGMMIGVPLGKDRYKKTGDRYQQKHITSYDAVKHATDFLVAGEYFEMPFGKGTWDPDSKQRRTTRYRASSRLLDLCEEYGINPYMIRPYVDSEVIILRMSKNPGQSQGNRIDYEDTEFTDRARENLRTINAFIFEHHLDLDIFDDQDEDLRLRMGKQEYPAKNNYLDFTKTRLKRIFNNASFEEGGRFYGGWWISVPVDYRSRITIDNEPTVELDYSGMHFAIMYADINMSIPMEDPYALEGYGTHLRSHIKKAFNIIINCASRDQAICAIDGRIKDGELSAELGNGKKLIEAFTDAHPLIKDKIASGEGVRGQFTDSQVAERVMLKGIDKGMCILPMHDGFITTKRDTDSLVEMMNEAFREITGRTAMIKPEAFDLSVLPHAGEYGTYFIRRPDGKVELNGPLEGEAIAFSPLYPELPQGSKYSKKNKEKREKEWKAVHG